MFKIELSELIIIFSPPTILYLSMPLNQASFSVRAGDSVKKPAVTGKHFLLLLLVTASPLLWVSASATLHVDLGARPLRVGAPLFWKL